MMKNNLPELNEIDKRTLTEFANANAESAQALKRVIGTYMEHFRDIRHVDLQDNVGLQTCSHVRAYDMLEEIFSELELFSSTAPDRKSKGFR